MSGKSGQLLTSSFYDDCENIVLENGVPTLKLKTSMRGFGGISKLDEAVKNYGISERVFKNLKLLAGVPMLHLVDETVNMEHLLSFSGYSHDGEQSPGYVIVTYQSILLSAAVLLVGIRFDPDSNQVSVTKVES